MNQQNRSATRHDIVAALFLLEDGLGQRGMSALIDMVARCPLAGSSAAAPRDAAERARLR